MKCVFSTSTCIGLCFLFYSDHDKGVPIFSMEAYVVAMLPVGRVVDEMGHHSLDTLISLVLTYSCGEFTRNLAFSFSR